MAFAAFELLMFAQQAKAGSIVIEALGHTFWPADQRVVAPEVVAVTSSAFSADLGVQATVLQNLRAERAVTLQAKFWN